MTASTVKSAQVSGFDSVPVTVVPSGKQGAAKVSYTGTIEAATTSIDEIGDIIKMVRIPSNLRITKVMLYNDDLDSHSTPLLAADVGFYNADTGAVKDADGLASAITTLQAENKTGVNVAWEAQDFANIGKTAWELAGYTSDPGVRLDIALTVTAAAATAATGTISMEVEGTLV